MGKFIYVFSEKDRDSLLNKGSVLLKSDDEHHLYIFENTADVQFDLLCTSFVFSDTLTF